MSGIFKNRNTKFVIMLLRFMRIRNCIMTFLGVIVGASVAYTGSQLLPLNGFVLTAAVAAALITAGGNTLNDYFDIETDKVNKPHRPIPAGRISKSDALMFSVSLFLFGLAFAKAVNKFTLAFAIVNTLALIVYARYSKRMLLVANLVISYLVASAFIYGALSIHEVGAPINLRTLELTLILSACAFFVTFSREVIKDIEDMQGDERIYSKTLPIVFGKKNTKKVAIFFTLTAIGLSILPLLTNHPGLVGMVYAPIIFLADLLFLSALTMYAPLGQRTMIAGMASALSAFLFGSVLTRI